MAADYPLSNSAARKEIRAKVGEPEVDYRGIIRPLIHAGCLTCVEFYQGAGDIPSLRLPQERRV